MADLSELLAARRGLPNEPKAARTVAMYLVMPGAVAGLALGLALFWNDKGDKPLHAAIVGAFAFGFGAVALVMLGYWLLGFGAVTRVADALLGAFAGLGPLLFFVWAADVSPWFLLLVPAGAVVGVAVGLAVGSAPPPAASSESAEPAEAVRATPAARKPWER